MAEESTTAEHEERADPAAAEETTLPQSEPKPDLGQPGPPFDRRAPFFVGFVGASGALLAFWLLSNIAAIGSTLLLIVVSLFLAAGLNPPVRFLEKRGLKRGYAVLVVVVVVIVVIVLFVGAIVPVIADQVASISQAAPGWFNQLLDNKQIQDLNDNYDIVDKARDYVTGGDFVSTLFGGAIGVGLALVGALFNAFIITVLTLYFLSSMNTTKRALYQLAPASRRDRVGKLGDQILESVGKYVSGAFIVALCAGLSTLVLLFAVGLGKYAVALAFVVAILDVIPMIGATIGAVVVCAIALAEDPTTFVICAIFYIAYQQFENYVVYPRVMSSSVDIPGSVTVIAALVGAALLGVVGALLAIPTAAAVLLLTREVVVRRQDQR